MVNALSQVFNGLQVLGGHRVSWLRCGHESYGK